MPQFSLCKTLPITPTSLHPAMRLDGLLFFLFTILLASPTLAVLIGHPLAATSRRARAFASRSRCEIISKPHLCDADGCFAEGGRCDMLRSGGSPPKCFPHMVSLGGHLVVGYWTKDALPKACYGCRCERMREVRGGTQGTRGNQGTRGAQETQGTQGNRLTRTIQGTRAIRKPPRTWGNNAATEIRGDEESSDAEFHRFLTEVVLGEAPRKVQPAKSPKRKKKKPF